MMCLRSSSPNANTPAPATSRARGRLRTSLAVVGLCLGLIPWASAQDPTDKLPRDEANRYGTLENGLRYVIRTSTNPPERVAAYLHIRSGALNETSAQNGLAHFLEHMAFNGSTHFAPGTLIPYMNELGMQFGADSNAHTNHHETVYKLFMPKNSDEMLGKALTIFSDVASGLLLLDAEIEKERKVILEEDRTRKGVGQRISDQLLPRLFPGSQFAAHDVIGDEQVIRTAPRDQFVDYWNAWYRPELMTLIVVGDIVPDQVIEKVTTQFGALKARAEARPPTGSGVRPIEENRAIVLADKEIPVAQVQLQAFAPGRPPMTTAGEFRFDTVENMGTWIISRRLQDRLQRGEAKYLNASVAVSGLYTDVILPGANAVGNPENWRDMLSEVIREIHRGVVHGVTQRECDLAKSEFLSDAERGVETEGTWDASTHLDRIADAIGTKAPLLSAAQRQTLIQKVMETVTPAEINGVLAKNYGGRAFTYVLILPERDEVARPSEEEVLAAAAAAWALETEALTESESALTLLAELPEPGLVESKVTDEDLGITTFTLTNGVVVHHRYMDYKKDSVSVRICMPGGVLQETAENRGVSAVAALMNATSRLKSTQIRDLMTGKNITVSGAISIDQATVTVSGSPKHLEEGMQLAHALLTDGRVEASSFDTWKESTLRQIEMMETLAQGQLQKTLAAVFFAGDPRFSPMTKEALASLSPAQGEAWGHAIMKGAPLEVAIVGDIREAEALPLALRYLGSLPKATRDIHCLDALRTVARGPGPYSKSVEFETLTPQAIVVSGFVGCDASDTKDRRALQLVTRILTDRMTTTVREEKQLAYGISCSSSPNPALRQGSLIIAGAVTDPDRTDELAKTLREMFASFVADGPTEEEVAAARKQLRNEFETGSKEPDFWLGILSDMRYRGRNLDEIKQLPGYYDSITAEQLKATAAKYFVDEQRLEFMVRPKTDPTP
ncbi:MAG: M16 family metallopeptidase [Planctomycetota bacterium]